MNRWEIIRIEKLLDKNQAKYYPFPYKEEEDYSYMDKSDYISYYTNTGDIQGYLRYNITKDNLSIESLYVFPDYRRKGIGTKLIKEAELIAVRSGCESITIGCAEKNRLVKKLYKRLGYETYHISKIKMLTK